MLLKVPHENSAELMSVRSCAKHNFETNPSSIFINAGASLLLTYKTAVHRNFDEQEFIKVTLNIWDMA